MNRTSLILTAALLAGGCQTTNIGPGGSIDAQKTRAVLDHHWSTFQGNDLDGVMADYTEDSILVTPNRTYTGLQEIRENFVSAFSVYPKSATTMQLNKSVAVKDIGYIIWQASAPKIKLTYGSDTFLIRDGKIMRQSFAGVSVPQ